MTPVVLMAGVVLVRVLLHPSAEVHPALAFDVPDTWWAGIFNTHDWLLHGYDEGEWLALVNAYLDGGTSHIYRPPAYPLLSAGLALIIGERVLAMHLVGHIVSVLVCLATYVLGTRLANRFVGVGAALVMASAPRVVKLQDDIAAFPLLVLAVLCLAIASLAVARNPTPAKGIPLGLAAALALTAHYTSAPFVIPAALLVLVVARRAALRPLAVATVLAVGLAGLVLATAPAKRVHSGGVTLMEFYQHGLRHPDGRGMADVLSPEEIDRLEHPLEKRTLLSADGPVVRTITGGPPAAYRAMTSGFGPTVLAPLVMGLMVLGIAWPGDDRQSRGLARWRHTLWLLTFL